MRHQIQKTIIANFLELVNKQSSSEAEINELIDTIRKLYERKILTNSDIYRQKIEVITEILTSKKSALDRKRVSKEISIELHNHVLDAFKNDLDLTDIKTKLSDLDKIENETSIDITVDNVAQVLENILIPKSKLNKEADLEYFLGWELAHVFGKDNLSNQYSVGGFLALKTDLDVGNGKVGIELKIADNLSATDMQRLIGQALYYKKRFYKENLLVLIASKYSMPSHIKELSDFITELGIKVIYKVGV